MDSRMTNGDVEALTQVPGVEAASEVVVATTRLEPRNFLFVFGLDPRQRIAGGLRVVAGRGLQGSDELLVGDVTSEQLELRAGDRVEIGRTRLHVVGLYHSGRAFLDTGTIVDIPTAQRLFDLGDRVNLVFLDLADDVELKPVLDHIHGTLPRLEASPSDLFAARLRNLDLVRVYARVLALLAVVVAAITVATTMSLGVVERRQEMALLRSLGWSRWRVARRIVGEALLQVAAGVCLAPPIAVAGLKLLPAGDLSGLLPPSIPLAVMAEGMAIVVVVGVLFSLGPAMQAMATRPAEALRSL
jgi:putative ABC transport system permease protein